MKKITYFMFIILGMVLMVGNVNADVAYEMDESWDIKGCEDFTDELKNAKKTFSLDPKTGIFTVSGDSYSESIGSGAGASASDFTFFTVGNNGKTLYSYTLTWDKAISMTGGFPEAWGTTPEYSCAKTLKLANSSHLAPGSDDPSDEPGDDPSDEPGDDDSISDPDNDSSSGSKTTTKTKSYTTNGGTQQTSSNPNTGISPFLSLPAILGGGIAIVLRKKRIFG